MIFRQTGRETGFSRGRCRVLDDEHRHHHCCRYASYPRENPAVEGNDARLLLLSIFGIHLRHEFVHERVVIINLRTIIVKHFS